MSYPEFIVLNKKDGTGRVGVAVSRLTSFEEVLGANTTTQFTIVQIGGGSTPKSFTVSESFHDILKAMNFKHVGEGREPEPPAGG